MPAPLYSRDEVLDRLMETFRAQGYDGASLTALSDASGLGRSSLYHHFPGGKQDMAHQVLQHLAVGLEADLLAPLRAPGSPAVRFTAMLSALDDFYDHGRKACLLERLCASVERDHFATPLAGVFRAWMDALTRLGCDAGLSPQDAAIRAEDVVVRVEGALVVAAGLGDPLVFSRTLDRIRSEWSVDGNLSAPGATAT
jgi:TetR/AcrR family transcriptional regulator, lmrAB and yxaGH operons repressor